MRIFELLDASEKSLSLEQLVQATAADSILLGDADASMISTIISSNAAKGRLLRYLSSMGMIKETGKDNFAATNVTKALASPGNQAGVRH